MVIPRFHFPATFTGLSTAAFTPAESHNVETWLITPTPSNNQGVVNTCKYTFSTYCARDLYLPLFVLVFFMCVDWLLLLAFLLFFPFISFFKGPLLNNWLWPDSINCKACSVLFSKAFPFLPFTCLCGDFGTCSWLLFQTFIWIWMLSIAISIQFEYFVKFKGLTRWSLAFWDLGHLSTIKWKDMKGFAM